MFSQIISKNKNLIKSSCIAALVTMTLLPAMLLYCGCSRQYTAEEMIGVYKSEATPTSVLSLNDGGSALVDFGGDEKFNGRWIRVSTDGIQVNTDAGGTMFYTILSKDKLQYLFNEEALKLGMKGNPYYNRTH